MQRYIYRTICIPQSVMCYVFDTLSLFVMDGLGDYKMPMNEEDLFILFDTMGSTASRVCERSLPTASLRDIFWENAMTDVMNNYEEEHKKEKENEDNSSDKPTFTETVLWSGSNIHFRASRVARRWIALNYVN